MILETAEQEKQYANQMIRDMLEINSECLRKLIDETKETKKAIRKLTKQSACEHDFKLKVVPNGADQYKCKKCKFECINYPN